ncbi:MAG: histidine kinase [Flavobacteriales bacterium]|nr:histidine kinase [Flavobacteriales bacterium]
MALVIFFLSANLLLCGQQVNSDIANQGVAAVDKRLANQIALLVLFPFLLSFAFIVFIFYRQKREADVQRRVVELEIRGLRAQMNPHFIFNSLNSINKFIQTDQSKEACNYLVKFSMLIRRVLQKSINDLVTLEDDIETLTLYLDLERMRTHENFNFHFDIDVPDPLDEIEVPPLLIQPFVENSVWHGFQSFKSGGEIRITISKESNELKFTIVDNGRLPEAVSVRKPADDNKKVSMGTSLTRERLRAMNSSGQSNARFVSTDLVDDQENYAGKKIELYLPYTLSV